MNVVRADGTFEVRCNTHGGEWGASAVTTTLTSSAASGQNTIITAAALAVGTPLVVGPVSQYAGETGKYVTAITGAGPYTETLSGNLNSTYAIGIVVSGLTGTYGSDFTYAFDLGDGAWNTLTDSFYMHQCRRFRMTWNTRVFRSDQSTPFASCAYTWITYADGTMRCDRTVTLLAAQAFQDYFVWMASYQPSGTGSFTAQGKIVSGQSVLSTCDFRLFLTTPVITSVATSATGGTLPAASKSYRLTPLTPQGEGLSSASVSVTSSGTTSSNTITFPSAQSGQTGWRVYDASGLLATLPVQSASYVDTGANGGSGQPPLVSTASVFGASSQYDITKSVSCDYNIYKESTSGSCFWMGLDRDAVIAAFPSATAVQTNLMCAPGITKSYWTMQSGSTSGTISQNNSTAGSGLYNVTLPINTVLSTTTWSGWYMPADPVNFDKDLTQKPVKYLPTVYPVN